MLYDSLILSFHLVTRTLFFFLAPTVEVHGRGLRVQLVVDVDDDLVAAAHLHARAGHLAEEERGVKGKGEYYQHNNAMHGCFLPFKYSKVNGLRLQPAAYFS